MPKITVDVSAQQARLFEVLAESAGAKPGEVMLGLACIHVTGNGWSDFPDDDLRALCWKYTRSREVPDASQWLSQNGLKKLGHDGPAVALVS